MAMRVVSSFSLMKCRSWRRGGVMGFSSEAGKEANSKEVDQSVSNEEQRVKSKPEHEDQEKKKGGEEEPKEFGGPAGLEPTRYGDWEKAGRCYDF